MVRSNSLRFFDWTKRRSIHFETITRLLGYWIIIICYNSMLPTETTTTTSIKTFFVSEKSVKMVLARRMYIMIKTCNRRVGRKQLYCTHIPGDEYTNNRVTGESGLWPGLRRSFRLEVARRRRCRRHLRRRRRCRFVNTCCPCTPDRGRRTTTGTVCPVRRRCLCRPHHRYAPETVCRSASCPRTRTGRTPRRISATRGPADRPRRTPAWTCTAGTPPPPPRWPWTAPPRCRPAPPRTSGSRRPCPRSWPGPRRSPSDSAARRRTRTWSWCTRPDPDTCEHVRTDLDNHWRNVIPSFRNGTMPERMQTRGDYWRPYDLKLSKVVVNYSWLFIHKYFKF